MPHLAAIAEAHPAPAVSVVIPAFNRAGSIVPAIESVLRQSYTDFERLLVVDDGSTDGTLAAAETVKETPGCG